MAYNTVNRSKLKVTLEALEIPKKLINLKEITLKDTDNMVKIRKESTKQFKE